MEREFAASIENNLIEKNKGKSTRKTISRRAFLKGSVAAGIGYGAYKVYDSSPWLQEIVTDQFRPDKLKSDIENLKRMIEQRYGFKITMKKIAYNESSPYQDHLGKWDNDGEKSYYYSGSEPSLVEQRDALNWLKKKITKYPPIFFTKLEIKELRLSSNLSRTRKNDLSVGDKLGGFWVSRESTMVMETKNLFSVYNPSVTWLGDEAKFDIIHELDHVVVTRTHKDGYEIEDQNVREFLNLSEFVGGHQGEHWYDQPSEPTGFASSYATSSYHEDHAEAAILLLDNPKHAAERAAVDKILREKFEIIKREYKEFTNGQMDERYWKDLKAGKVDEVYWINREKEKNEQL